MKLLLPSNIAPIVKNTTEAPDTMKNNITKWRLISKRKSLRVSQLFKYTWSPLSSIQVTHVVLIQQI